MEQYRQTRQLIIIGIEGKKHQTDNSTELISMEALERHKTYDHYLHALF